MSLTKRLNGSGMTMIELVVAATIAAGIIVAVLGGLTEVEQLNRTARAQTIATEVAQQELEKVRNTPYPNLNTGTTDLSSSLTPYATLESPRTFTRTVTVVDAGGLKQVDFDLSYTIYHRTKRIKLSTEVSNIGINL